MNSEPDSLELPPINTTATGLVVDLDDDSARPMSAGKSKHPSTVELTSALGIPTKARSRRVWTREEDEKLRRLVAHWGDQRGKNSHWDQISAQFENRTNKDCRKRWFHSLDPTLKRGRWTEDEDRVLLEAFEKMGSVWNKIAQLIPGRTDDQCSKRYNDVLDPSVRDRLREWTKEEDGTLKQLVETHGTQWRIISKYMEGRTGLTCRNRWRKIVASVLPKGAPPPARKPTKRKRSSTDSDMMRDDNSDEHRNSVDMEDSVMTDPKPNIGNMGPPYPKPNAQGHPSITSPPLNLYSPSTPNSAHSRMSVMAIPPTFDTYKPHGTSNNYLGGDPMSVAGMTHRAREEYSPSGPIPESPMTSALLQQVKATPIPAPKDSNAAAQDDYTRTTTYYTFSLDKGLRKSGEQQGPSGEMDESELEQMNSVQHGLNASSLETLIKMAAASGQQIAIHQHNYHHHHHHHYYDQPNSNKLKPSMTTSPTKTRPTSQSSMNTTANHENTSHLLNYYNRIQNGTGNPSQVPSQKHTSSSSSASTKPLSTNDVSNLSALFSELEELEVDGAEHHHFGSFPPAPHPPMPSSASSSSSYKMEDLQFAFEGIPFNPS